MLVFFDLDVLEGQLIISLKVQSEFDRLMDGV